MAYKLKSNVDWYANDGIEPSHNQKHPITKKYWNTFSKKWLKNKSKTISNNNNLTRKSISYYELQIFSLESIIKNFDPILFEKVAMFLSMVYCRSFSLSKQKNMYRYWSDKDFRAILGFHRSEILKKLRALKIISIRKTKESKYDATKLLTYIKIRSLLIENNPGSESRRYIKNQSYQKTLQSYFRNRKLSCEDSSPFITQIENSLVNTSIEIPDLENIIDKIVYRKTKETEFKTINPFISNRGHRIALKKLNDINTGEIDLRKPLQIKYNYFRTIQDIENIDQKLSYYNVGKQTFGFRIGHSYSNAPKEFRKYLKIDNQETVELDIRTSQPLFLYTLIKLLEEGLFKESTASSIPIPYDYLELIETIYSSESPDIYSYGAKKLETKFEEKFDRKHLKTLFFKLFFGHPERNIASYTREELVSGIIGKDFYNFLRKVYYSDLNLDTAKRKNLPFMLQRIESGFMEGIFKLLTEEDIKFIPVYDCIIVKKNDEKKTLEIAKKEIVESSHCQFISFESD